MFISEPGCGPSSSASKPKMGREQGGQEGRGGFQVPPALVHFFCLLTDGQRWKACRIRPAVVRQEEGLTVTLIFQMNVKR